MAERRFNPLDPLGLFEPFRRDMERIRKTISPAKSQVPIVDKPVYSYRNQVPRQGKFSGIRLDTFEKAKEYIDWQYEMGLITREEKLTGYRTISEEFDRWELFGY